MKMSQKLTPVKFCTAPQLRRLFSVAYPRSPFGARDCAMLRLVYYTGLRVQELVNLKIENVRGLTCPRGVLALPGAYCKGGYPRQIPLCSEAQQAIDELFDFLARRGFSTHGAAPLLQDRHHRPLPAREVQRAAQLFSRRAGLDVPASPHTLRHSFAARLSAEKVPVRTIQLLLGHRKLETTEIYLQAVSESLAQAVQKLAL